MTTPKIIGAIDLGASSGRVIAGVFGAGAGSAGAGAAGLELHEIARFPNGPVERHGKLFWDFDALLKAIVEGVAKLGQFAQELGAPVISIGIDTWAVDYGLIGTDGQLLAQPRHYRDARNVIGAELVHQTLPQEQLYQINGLQYQPFNTLYQLTAEKHQDPSLFAQAKTVLLMPDLIAYLLTGVARAEITNASTTGMLDVRHQVWNQQLLYQLRLDDSLLPPLIKPGEAYGPLIETLRTSPALAATNVIAVGSHDTASAVAAVPKLAAGGAYLSSGTWSLIGVELASPVLTEASYRANFTNELGVNFKVRYLKNLTGLWLLQECVRVWDSRGHNINLAELVGTAANQTVTARINVNDPEFAPPGDMPARIQAHCKRSGQQVPQTPGQIARVILDSLADSYAEAIEQIQTLTGAKVTQLNIVGGGTQNQLLNQLAANATGLTVVAGPVEATAIGNLVTQAAAAGIVPADLASQRAFIAASFEPETYQPQLTPTTPKAVLL